MAIYSLATCKHPVKNEKSSHVLCVIMVHYQIIQTNTIMVGKCGGDNCLVKVDKILVTKGLVTERSAKRLLIVTH